MYKRSLVLPKDARSFFLWGPRQTGKSSLLQASYPQGMRIDLLKSDLLIKYQMRPYLLREEIELLVRRGQAPRRIVIDEVQKVPLLLSEVHWLIENRRIPFALCGSSARKVRRGHANLLGGRATRLQLRGLTAREIGSEFDLVRFLNHGGLPPHYLSDSPRDLLRAYCADYLKEEIAAEGLVRNLPAFAGFLEMAALSDCEQLSYAALARDTGVSAPTAKSYFEILEDTLLVSFVPSYRRRPKRRTEVSPKVYFFDVGVAGFLAKRGHVEPGGELFGKAFESWVHHELCAYRDYFDPDLDLSYWRLSSGIEVDFILSRGRGQPAIAIEAKSTARVHADHLRGLREMKREYPGLARRWVVCLEDRPRVTEDGIEIWPYREWVEALPELLGR
jgi:predicted AAA+ superfamily ATPase